MIKEEELEKKQKKEKEFKIKLDLFRKRILYAKIAG